MRQLGLGRKPCDHGICEILESCLIKKLSSSQFSFERQNHEENINLKTCQMKKDHKKNKDQI
jgi:hypothetical protein